MLLELGRAGLADVVAGQPERVLAPHVLSQPPGALLPRRLAHARRRIRSPGSTTRTTCPWRSWPPDAPDGRIRPYPIFNAAINLVAGKNLAWQERKAASFVFTPEYCGFEYRDDDDPPAERKAAATRAAEDRGGAAEGGRQRRGHAPARDAGVKRLSAYARTSRARRAIRRSLTMGLAIATSGAAASPNMGYHCSPTLAFLMTVFNVRLGWWLRNPRFPSRVDRREAPACRCASCSTSCSA